MQPQQPVAPSDAQPAEDVQATVEEGSEPRTPASRNFLQRLFRGRGSQESETQDQAESAQPSTVALTQEELDRRVQAETDRRESKRSEQARAAERRRLRDEDPWAYAEQDRQAEQVGQTDQQVSTLFAQIGAQHDRYALDPLVLSLPEAEQKRILAMQGAGVGLDGRKLIVTESLKALEKHWKEEGEKQAEQKLRRNPAFRKQVLGEFRRGTPEPEYIGSGAPSAADKDVSNILRNQIGTRH
jgi:hypothetical protein